MLGGDADEGMEIAWGGAQGRDERSEFNGLGPRAEDGENSVHRGDGEWIDSGPGRRGFVLLVAVGDAAFGEIVGRHLDGHAVTGEDADAVPAKLSSEVGEDEPLVDIQLNAKLTGGKFFHYGAGHLNAIVFTH